MNDLCSGAMMPQVLRSRLLAWLGEGAREVAWALCAVPRERWTRAPAAQPGTWPVARHVHHLAVREAQHTLPSVRRMLGELAAEAVPSVAELDRADATWDAADALESVEARVRGLAETRFELLQRVESAPDEVWQPGLREGALPLLLLRARQHELEHLAAMWNLALYWDRRSPAGPRDHAGPAGLPLHPADRSS